MEIKTAINALAAIAHETRLQIFRMLVKTCPDGLPAGEIAASLGIPNATLSFHLNHLTQAELITCTRSGRSLIYALNSPAVRELLAFLTEDCCQGKAELCSVTLASVSSGCCGSSSASCEAASE